MLTGRRSEFSLKSQAAVEGGEGCAKWNLLQLVSEFGSLSSRDLSSLCCDPSESQSMQRLALASLIQVLQLLCHSDPVKRPDDGSSVVALLETEGDMRMITSS